MRSRYASTQVRMASSPTSSGCAFSLATTTRLAANRLTSHSNGPGSVSSKSRNANASCRSGVAHNPKFRTCASPHIWTSRPVWEHPARSAAMTAAAPRKYVHGDAVIRPYRSGSRSGTRIDSCARSRSSATPSPRCHSCCRLRGTWTRAARPKAWLRSGDSGAMSIRRSLLDVRRQRIGTVGKTTRYAAGRLNAQTTSGGAVNKTLIAALNEQERLLVAETERDALDALEEEEGLARPRRTP